MEWVSVRDHETRLAAVARCGVRRRQRASAEAAGEAAGDRPASGASHPHAAASTGEPTVHRAAASAKSPDPPVAPDRASAASTIAAAGQLLCSFGKWVWVGNF